MEIWHAIILGIVQGATEFLPVSSSGHLVIVQSWLGISEGALSFDAIIHFGSLMAVIYVFRGELLLMAQGVLGKGEPQQVRLGRRLLGLLFIATVPLVVVGLALRDIIESAFTSAYVAAALLAGTGLLLWIAEKRQHQAGDSEPRRGHALWMGLAQAAAVLPGLSRSGTTIAVGMLAGLTREGAARFSFLMSIPALLGATALELRSVFNDPSLQGVLEPGVLVVGIITTAIASYAAIALLLRFLQRGRLIFFAYYTWVLALVTLLVTRGG